MSLILHLYILRDTSDNGTKTFYESELRDPRKSSIYTRALHSKRDTCIFTADYVNLDFTIKDLDGKTGLNLAQNAGKTEVVKLIKRKLKSISL